MRKHPFGKVVFLALGSRMGESAWLCVVPLVVGHHVFLSLAKNRNWCVCGWQVRGPWTAAPGPCVWELFSKAPREAAHSVPCHRALFCEELFIDVGLNPIERKIFPVKLEWSFVMHVKIKPIGWLMKNNCSQKWLKMWNLKCGTKVIEELRSCSLPAELAGKYLNMLSTWAIQGIAETPHSNFKTCFLVPFVILGSIDLFWAFSIPSAKLNEMTFWTCSGPRVVFRWLGPTCDFPSLKCLFNAWPLLLSSLSELDPSCPKSG